MFLIPDSASVSETFSTNPRSRRIVAMPALKFECGYWQVLLPALPALRITVIKSPIVS